MFKFYRRQSIWVLLFYDVSKEDSQVLKDEYKELANKMFGFSAINESMNERSGVALFISEIISTFGLLLVIFGTKKKEKIIVALCVGMYISSAIWFSSSTSFANPAVSIARTLTDSFTGSRMQDMPFFIFAQIIGTIVATFFIGGWLFKKN